MSEQAYWRVRPTPFIEQAVRKIATKEGRQISNTLHKLLSEAIFARERRRAEFEKIKELAAKAGGDHYKKSAS